jgi:hypothetical protein
MLWDWKQIGLSALGGAVAGAISAIPIPGSSFISYGLTFLAGGTASVVGGMISGSVQDIESGVIAFFLGGAANVFGKGISDLIQHFKVNKIVSNISNKAQSIANMGAKQKSLTIWNMIGVDNFTRNSYKSWGYDQIFNLLMTEASNQLQIIHIKNLTRYFVYSSTTSSLLSGWY